MAGPSVNKGMDANNNKKSSSLLKVNIQKISIPNSVGEPQSDAEGEEIVGEDVRDAISGKRNIGESIPNMKKF